MPNPIDFPNRIGGDLLWWRAVGGWSTHVTLFWPNEPLFDDAAHVEAVLFEQSGCPRANWRFPLVRGRPVCIDSDSAGPWQGAGAIEGVLALTVCTDGTPGPGPLHHERLFPFVDWIGPAGEVASLHSDQVMRFGRQARQEWTEIVVRESTSEHNALVILNGEDVQPAGAIELRFTNALGQARSGRYAAAMAPFSIHRIELDAVLPGLASFAAGEPVLVGGVFTSKGLFSRPYVETCGERYGVYHAGDVYQWNAMPHFEHALIGGEVNPVAVLHDAHHRTLIHLLHSHGDLDGDVPVDAALYDLGGNLVSQRRPWRTARRNALEHADVSELLPDAQQPFRGHLALSFAPAPRQDVPRRLQALVEYAAPASTAHVMAWSDEWNSRVRLALRDRDASWPESSSYCRVLGRDGWTTQVSITNAGHGDAGRAAEISLTLVGESGVMGRRKVSLAPYATLLATTTDLFPRSGSQRGVLVASSGNDLANIAFTYSSRDGPLAAEHFMALPLRDASGRWRAVAGA